MPDFFGAAGHGAVFDRCRPLGVVVGHGREDVGIGDDAVARQGPA